MKVENAVVCHGQTKLGYKAIDPILGPVLNKFNNHVTRFRNFGAYGVEFAFVACGKFDGNIFLNDTIWDYFPGMFICKQAGGFCFEEKIKNKKIYAVFATQELCELFKKILKEELKKQK